MGAGAPDVPDVADVEQTVPLAPVRTPGRLAGLARTGPRRAVLLLVAFLAVAGLEWLRMPGRSWDQLYAEDGQIFLQQWAADPALGTLIEPYAGYWHLIPRLVAVVVAALPVSWWAAATSAAACLVVAGVVVLVWVLGRDVFGAWWARAAAALIPLLLPLARLEAVGDLNNLHSYMVYLLLFVLLAQPQYRIGANGLMAVAFLAAGTEIQAGLLLPLAVFAVWRDRGRIRPFLGWSLGMAAQSWVFLTTPAMGRGGGLRDVGSGFLGWALHAAGTTAIADTAVLGRLVLRVGWWLPVLALAYFVGCAALAAVLAGRRSTLRLVAVAVVPLSAAMWGASYFVNAHAGLDYADLPTVAQPLMPLTRWGIAPAMMLALAVPLAGQALASARPRMAWAGVTAVVVLLSLMATWFDTGSTVREQRDWTSDVAAAERACAATTAPTVRIPIMTWGNWAVVVPCARL